MADDAQGHALTGGNPAAAGALDQAVRAFTLAYGDANAHLEAADAAASSCVMVHLMKAWVLALSNDPVQVARSREMLDGIDTRGMNDREAAHLASLRHAAEGRWLSAVAKLDRHLLSYPHDLLAHQVVMRLDGFLGRFHRAAGRSARALPLWSKDQPGYGILLSFYGFGLEESGDYALAEDVSRAAAELEPHGYWPHHSVSHVLEMTGRPDEGVAWMEDRLPLWGAQENVNRVHIWWHKALFHVELGQYEQALALYDEEILPALRPIGTSLCNATALLWRLEALGCEAGERWRHQFGLWQNRANGRASLFNDVHAAMTALRADEMTAYDALLAGMRETAASQHELAVAYHEVGVPIVEALGSYVRGRYGEAIDRLFPVRSELWRMGGSKAQRDLVEWTLAEAAIRAHARDMAVALANERLAERPGSAVNQRFREVAYEI